LRARNLAKECHSLGCAFCHAGRSSASPHQEMRRTGLKSIIVL
jgi:hypothetical protein